MFHGWLIYKGGSSFSEEKEEGVDGGVLVYGLGREEGGENVILLEKIYLPD